MEGGDGRLMMVLVQRHEGAVQGGGGEGILPDTK